MLDAVRMRTSVTGVTGTSSSSRAGGAADPSAMDAEEMVVMVAGGCPTDHAYFGDVRRRWPPSPFPSPLRWLQLGIIGSFDAAVPFR
jgi:hypothetical protein